MSPMQSLALDNLSEVKGLMNADLDLDPRAF